MNKLAEINEFDPQLYLYLSTIDFLLRMNWVPWFIQQAQNIKTEEAIQCWQGIPNAKSKIKETYKGVKMIINIITYAVKMMMIETQNTNGYFSLDIFHMSTHLFIKYLKRSVDEHITKIQPKSTLIQQQEYQYFKENQWEQCKYIMQMFKYWLNNIYFPKSLVFIILNFIYFGFSYSQLYIFLIIVICS